jgi:hypothetical protein
MIFFGLAVNAEENKMSLKIEDLRIGQEVYYKGRKAIVHGLYGGSAPEPICLFYSSDYDYIGWVKLKEINLNKPKKKEK